MRVKKAQYQEIQLSLFEENNEVQATHKPSVLDFVRARFEYGPDMDQEEYKRWIKILINNSLRSMD